RQVRPDAIFTALEGGIAVAFVRQWAAMAPDDEDIPLFGTVRTFGRPLLTAIGPAALGAQHAAAWSDEMDYPANRRFTAEFELEYGRGPSMWALRGYEAALMLEAAVKIAGGIGDRQKLRQALRGFELASPRGPLRFRPDQMVAETIYLRQVVLTPSGRVGHEIRSTLEVRATPPGPCAIIDPPPEKK
ncbi:MAG: ABC transporter substrate-binding protein, partial [Alphaproteobacteria bacterium]|nr:ABC transporter substrate-binding protein [Alphaproteobacteria bacterium]